MRPFEIAVLGATGFTGGKVAEYLARNAPADLRWAIAGRNAPKLAQVKARLCAIDPRCERVATLEASVDDSASLARLAESTEVLITTVGPFIQYGEPVVRACVEQGTDYIDSTGEPNFVELVRARFADEAARRKLRLVSCCGFDSIPADLGVLFTVLQLPGDQSLRVRGYLQLDAAFSGGTERSAILALVPPERAPAGPPSAGAGRRVRLEPGKVSHQKRLGGWAAPVPTVDASIVLRSAASIGRYGPDFSYGHYVLHRSLLALIAAAWVFGGLALLVRFAPLRAFFLKLVKKSGEGPSEEKMAKSWFKLRFVAECGGKTLQTEVSGGDPGYGETSKMLAESALCLCRDRARLPERSGALTPAEAMGEPLLERLQRAGLKFAVV